MSKKQSAGLLVYKKSKNKLEVFLVHPGGPFWKNKDAGAWSIPKGEFENDEMPLTAAIREFKEEIGKTIQGKFTELNPIEQKSGKKVYAWAVEENIDASNFVSNTFGMEWPPHSGKIQSFPEVDKCAWFLISDAREKINIAQVAFLTELENKLMGG
ncbi:MAG: NUDIX domain-containing protein [Ginsengibacter sp.]